MTNHPPPSAVPERGALLLLSDLLSLTSRELRLTSPEWTAASGCSSGGRVAVKAAARSRPNDKLEHWLFCAWPQRDLHRASSRFTPCICVEVVKVCFDVTFTVFAAVVCLFLTEMIRSNKSVCVKASDFSWLKLQIVCGWAVKRGGGRGVRSPL